jgi:hypothetical protein
MKILLCSLGMALVAVQAQPVTYGVKLGAPVNDASQTSSTSVSSPGRWTGGPFVELHLPWRLSVEFSALFRNSRENDFRAYRLGEMQSSYLLTSADRVRTWDFPLLLKYRFREGKFRPYVGAGGAWSHRSSDFEAYTSCLGPEGSCTPPDYPFQLSGASFQSKLTKFGPAASAGFDMKTKYVTISPEVRWNRVFSGASTKDQFSVVVGFGFGR